MSGCEKLFTSTNELNLEMQSLSRSLGYVPRGMVGTSTRVTLSSSSLSGSAIELGVVRSLLRNPGSRIALGAEFLLEAARHASKEELALVWRVEPVRRLGD